MQHRKVRAPSASHKSVEPLVDAIVWRAICRQRRAHHGSDATQVSVMRDAARLLVCGPRERHDIALRDAARLSARSPRERRDIALRDAARLMACGPRERRDAALRGAQAISKWIQDDWSSSEALPDIKAENRQIEEALEIIARRHRQVQEQHQLFRQQTRKVPAFTSNHRPKDRDLYAAIWDARELWRARFGRVPRSNEHAFADFVLNVLADAARQALKLAGFQGDGKFPFKAYSASAVRDALSGIEKGERHLQKVISPGRPVSVTFNRRRLP